MAQYDPAFHARLFVDERALSRIKSDLGSAVQERDNTRRLIDELLRKVADADADIADLSAQRDLLTSSILRRRASLPLPTLPAEILGMIFQHSTDLCLASHTIGLQPVRCAQVCRHWRSAALNMASLWTHISVEYYARGPTAEQWRRLVQHRLLHSGACPLRIDINFHDLESELAPRDYRHILSDLMGHCSRWRHLTIQGLLFGDSHWDLLALLRCRTPSLESVEFSFRQPCPSAPLEELPTYLPHAPRLTHAHFANVPVAFNRGGGDEPLMLPAVSLALYDSVYYLTDFKATVASFPALTSLEIGWGDCDASNTDALSELPIRLPELQTLLLYRDDMDNSDVVYTSFALILDVLDAPKLRVLQLESELLDCAQGLLSRSTRTLQELQFMNGSLDDVGLVDVITSLQSLQKIAFDSVDISPEFTAALVEASSSADGAVIWPKLEHMVLNVCDYESDDLLHFMRQRYPLNAPFPALCPVLEVEGLFMDSLLLAEIRHILDTERERRRDENNHTQLV